MQILDRTDEPEGGLTTQGRRRMPRSCSVSAKTTCVGLAVAQKGRQLGSGQPCTARAASSPCGSWSSRPSGICGTSSCSSLRRTPMASFEVRYEKGLPLDLEIRLILWGVREGIPAVFGWGCSGLGCSWLVDQPSRRKRGLPAATIPSRVPTRRTAGGNAIPGIRRRLGATRTVSHRSVLWRRLVDG